MQPVRSCTAVSYTHLDVYKRQEKHIGKTDIMIAVGFSAGGMNVMQVVADQFGTTNTPDKV